MLLTQDFQHGEALGTVKRKNPRGGEMDAALYVKALSGVYPELKVTVTDALNDIVAVTRLGSVSQFASLAVQIVDIRGLPFEWPKPLHSPEAIDKAYQHYMYDDSGLWDELQKIADELNNPNGVEAGPKEALTSEQLADPLSVSAAVNGKMDSRSA
jgi:hypothetical protein